MAKQPKRRAWPAEKVQLWPVKKIIPYQKNPRTHSDEQVKLIAGSMKRYGVTAPVLVDEKGVLIYGHGRLLAAKQLGLEKLPVSVARGWTEEKKRAYRVSDNQLALLSSWDVPLLAEELHDLSLAGYEMESLGFRETELVEFMAYIDGDVDEEAEKIPLLPKVPVSKKGDLWVLGEHRLLCGDCTVSADVEKIMKGERAWLMNTDPPYGIDYGKIRDSIRASGRGGIDWGEMENDRLDGKALQEFLEKCIRTALPILIDNPAFYLWHPMLTQGAFFAAAAAAADILIHRQIIWVKPSLILGRGDYHWRHELCFYGWIRGKHCQWLAGHDQDTVWQVGRENDQLHPTQKPTQLFVQPIYNHTHPGDIVYEPFCGSGSQIIAAEKTGRRCFALEIDPIFVDVAIERWQDYTGKQAKLEGQWDRMWKKPFSQPDIATPAGSPE